MRYARISDAPEPRLSADCDVLPEDVGAGQTSSSDLISSLHHLGIFQALIEGLREQAALVDVESATILAVNDAWAETSRLHGFGEFEPGRNYLVELAKLAASTQYQPAQDALHAVEEILEGKRTFFRMVYDGRGNHADRKFEVRIALLKVAGHKYIRVTRYDVTELAELRSMREAINSVVMKAQEDERRRMGRELHDCGLQLLTVLSLSLARLKHARTKGGMAEVAGELEDLLSEAQKEFRSISYLSHSPRIEEFGLEEALRSLVEGFGERSGLEATFTVEGEVAVTSDDVAHTIFRVVQEALSNIHRHAHANRLAVQLISRKRMLHVAVVDDGRGIPARINRGVGLSGMKARMQELGGRLSLRDRAPGTLILASLPIGILGPAD